LREHRRSSASIPSLFREHKGPTSLPFTITCNLYGRPSDYLYRGSHRGGWVILMNDMIGNGARVLVVDDDKDVREVISDRLDHLGFVVVQASDGLDALAKMHQRRFDVVVTDCNMPRLDGLDFLRQCQLSWPATPVILMSAARDAMEKLAVACGAFGGLRKPFDANRLITLVCQAARRSIPLDPPSSGSEFNTGS